MVRVQRHHEADREVRVDALGERLGALRLCEADALLRMQQSLGRVGQLSAIAVFAAEGGELEVIDGFKRLRAARALGWSALDAHVLAVDAVEAKVAMGALHDRRGLTELEEAWLVRSLYRDDALGQPEIARRLGRHKSWVCRRLLVAEALDEAVQADVRLGLLSPSAAAVLARLPRRNQRPAAQVVTRTGMTFQQTARLVTELLGCPDEAARADLLERTLVRPPPRAAPHPTRRERTAAEWMMSDVASLTRVGARLEARLLSQPLLAFGPRVAEVASDALSSLVPVLHALLRTITYVTGKDPHDAPLAHPRGAAPPDARPEQPRVDPPGHRPGALDQPEYGP